MNKSAVLLLGAGIGAAAAYFFDPDRGRRRRALLRDQTAHARHKLQNAVAATVADVSNRAQGYRASLRSRRDKDAPSDDVLRERVRAAVGHAVGHPGAVEVTVTNGLVTLAGPVLADEAPLLIDRVLDVRGVRDIVSRLDAHKDAGHVPALQGKGKNAEGSRGEFLQRRWSPAARFAAGAAGAAACVSGFAGRGIARKSIGLAGLALLARAAANTELRRLARFRAHRRAISLRKTLRINAPIERVFDLWARGEDYPHFMSHVREVRRLDGARESGRWHWKVRGPSGLEFEFDSAIMAFEENRFIAWRTEAGAWVQHAGSVRFHANPDRSTTIDVRMSYQPAAGTVGHAVAKLLGDEPKHQLDDDLARMKTYLETGKPPRAAAAAPRPAL